MPTSASMSSSPNGASTTLRSSNSSEMYLASPWLELRGEAQRPCRWRRRPARPRRRRRSRGRHRRPPRSRRARSAAPRRCRASRGRGRAWSRGSLTARSRCLQGGLRVEVRTAAANAAADGSSPNTRMSPSAEPASSLRKMLVRGKRERRPSSGRAPSSGSWISVSPLTKSRLVSRPESRTRTRTATPSAGPARWRCRSPHPKTSDARPGEVARRGPRRAAASLGCGERQQHCGAG